MTTESKSDPHFSADPPGSGTGPARLFFWLLVTVYTICLPYVIFVFRALNRNFSKEIAAKVPFGIILCFAAVYLILGIKNKRLPASLLAMAVSGIIIYIIMMFQPNVNKHIHIPEYLVMCWLLFKALSIDYEGSGIFLLIFICASMLGVVDELLQGIHPQRFYGWSDMLVNAASSLIGVLALAALKPSSTSQWAWVKHLKRYRGSLAVILLGSCTAVLMCQYLFELKESDTFWNAYPRWLFGLNGAFLVCAMSAVIYNWRRLRLLGHRPAGKTGEPASVVVTAHLWILCPLVLLTVMHALVVWVGVAGHGFK